MAGDNTDRPADLNSENSARRQFRYLHRYKDSEYIETLAFPVGWLDSNGLTYRDEGVYRDGVLLAPHEYPPFEPEISEPPARSLLDKSIKKKPDGFPDGDSSIEADHS